MISSDLVITRVLFGILQRHKRQRVHTRTRTTHTHTSFNSAFHIDSPPNWNGLFTPAAKSLKTLGRKKWPNKQVRRRRVPLSGDPLHLQPLGGWGGSRGGGNTQIADSFAPPHLFDSASKEMRPAVDRCGGLADDALRPLVSDQMLVARLPGLFNSSSSSSSGVTSSGTWVPPATGPGGNESGPPARPSYLPARRFQL